MTKLNTKIISRFQKYPVLIEMEKLFPAGIPLELKGKLHEQSVLWEKLISHAAGGAEELKLSNHSGDFAILKSRGESKLMNELNIYKAGSAVFQAVYEDQISCYMEAFECGFTEINH